MARANRVRRGQNAGHVNETRLLDERQGKFLGTAKVDFRFLSFRRPPVRKADARKETWLLSTFQNEDCCRLPAENHIPAVLTRDAFQDAVSFSGVPVENVTSRRPVDWQKVKFRPGCQILCLQGWHRIEAAKKYLREDDRWWTIDLYSDDLSDELRASLEQHTWREWPISRGEICYHIFREESGHSVEPGHSWWSRLQSSDEERELRRLLARPDLRSAFTSLVEIPALWPGVRPGVVGSILRTKCDEENGRHLRHVHQFWANLLGHDRPAMAKLDAYTVETVQLRSPAHSLSDRRFLRPLLETGDIFGSFDREERARIWTGLLNFPGLVPSFHTFFENFKYLEIVADCVKKLIRPVALQTVRQALEEAFSEKAMARNDPNFEHSRFDDLATDRGGKLDLASRKLFLYAMRNLEELRPGSVLVGRKQHKTVGEKSVHTWHSFAGLAAALGFQSPGITEQLLDNPDRAAARHNLLLARNPSKYQYDEGQFESYVEEIAAVYTKARQRARRRPSFDLLCSDAGEEVMRRCGCPHMQAYLECAGNLECSGNLYLDGVHQSDPDAAAELTALYVRRDVCLAYFGPLEKGGPVHNLNEQPIGSPRLPEDLVVTPESRQRRGSASTIRRSPPPSPHGSQTLTLSTQLQNRRIADSPSVYSQTGASEAPRTEGGDLLNLSGRSPTPTAEQSLSLQHNAYGESAAIQFVRFEDGQFEVDQEVYFLGDDDPAVEQVASSYTQQDLIPLSGRMRSLAPSQCRQATMEDQSGTIVLVANAAIDQDTIRSMEGKRKEVEEDGKLGPS